MDNEYTKRGTDLGKDMVNKLKENQEMRTDMKEMQTQEENKATLTYRESGIDERIIRAVEELGFEHMTPIQEQAIPVFLSGM